MFLERTSSLDVQSELPNVAQAKESRKGRAGG